MFTTNIATANSAIFFIGLIDFYTACDVDRNCIEPRSIHNAVHD
jgi:hypothetical protein